MISVKNLTKRYGKTSVYENFSIDIEESKITCILGESGCGKTTLLNVLAGLTSYEGQVDKVKCSYVFQKPNLFDNLTVKDNLLLVSKDIKKTEDVAFELKISDKLSSYPKHLSGGQAQRVALARGILFDSDILLMDEPFSSLDLKLKTEIISYFSKSLATEKRTALFVTHDVDEAIALADRIIVLKEGKIVFNLNIDLPSDKKVYGSDGEDRKLLLSALMK